MPPRSHLEETLAFHIKALNLPPPQREYAFDDGRKWRFDFAWPCIKVAVEVEGGLYHQGRHNTRSGMVADMVKYNAAAIAGWCVLRYDSQAVNNGTAIDQIERVLNDRYPDIPRHRPNGPEGVPGDG